MEFVAASELPSGEGWQYEPKWDGFRCILSRRGRSVRLWSKAGRPLERYFPEIVECALNVRAARFVLDGELVIAAERGGSFDELLQRIHPARSRVAALAKSTPALFVAFDLLGDHKGGNVKKLPLEDRRVRLERFAKEFFRPARCVRLSPATTALGTARQWLRRERGEFDGVVAKRLAQRYEPKTRKYGVKVKRKKSADCVVGGFRYAANGGVGSLLLGLYDRQGKLHHVGFISGLSAEERTRLAKALRPLIRRPGFTGRAPGGPSRWRKRDAGDWLPLAPTLVVEAEFDKVTGGRIRHAARLRRWRPDKRASQCTMAQLNG